MSPEHEVRSVVAEALRAELLREPRPKHLHFVVVDGIDEPLCLDPALAAQRWCVEVAVRRLQLAVDALTGGRLGPVDVRECALIAAEMERDLEMELRQLRHLVDAADDEYQDSGEELYELFDDWRASAVGLMEHRLRQLAPDLVASALNGARAVPPPTGPMRAREVVKQLGVWSERGEPATDSIKSARSDLLRQIRETGHAPDPASLRDVLQVARNFREAVWLPEHLEQARRRFDVRVPLAEREAVERCPAWRRWFDERAAALVEHAIRARAPQRTVRTGKNR